MKNLYVGNLSISVTEDQLRAVFEIHGTVHTVTLVKDRDSGHPRGFAFVEMANDDEADCAIKALNGTPLQDQTLSINEARSKHEGLEGKTIIEQRTHPREALPTRTHRAHRY